jgi:hypothetical protein
MIPGTGDLIPFKVSYNYCALTQQADPLGEVCRRTIYYLGKNEITR